MIISLAAVIQKKKDLAFNVRQIEKTVRSCQGSDFVCFGEAFLQGFDSLCWIPDQDRKIALASESPVLQNLRRLAAACKTGLAFGYYRLENGRISSNYQVISKTGEILADYQRMSSGWRWAEADQSVYQEGSQACSFVFEQRRIALCLCGDGWTESAADKIAGEQADLLWWPVYVCFPPEAWLSTELQAYGSQSVRMAPEALWVNSLDTAEAEVPACGGAVYYQNGKPVKSVLPMSESILTLKL